MRFGISPPSPGREGQGRGAKEEDLKTLETGLPSSVRWLILVISWF